MTLRDIGIHGKGREGDRKKKKLLGTKKVDTPRKDNMHMEENFLLKKKYSNGQRRTIRRKVEGGRV